MTFGKGSKTNKVHTQAHDHGTYKAAAAAAVVGEQTQRSHEFAEVCNQRFTGLASTGSDRCRQSPYPGQTLQQRVQHLTLPHLVHPHGEHARADSTGRYRRRVAAAGTIRRRHKRRRCNRIWSRITTAACGNWHDVGGTSDGVTTGSATASSSR